MAVTVLVTSKDNRKAVRQVGLRRCGNVVPRNVVNEAGEAPDWEQQQVTKTDKDVCEGEEEGEEEGEGRIRGGKRKKDSKLLVVLIQASSGLLARSAWCGALRPVS